MACHSHDVEVALAGLVVGSKGREGDTGKEDHHHHHGRKEEVAHHTAVVDHRAWNVKMVVA